MNVIHLDSLYSHIGQAFFEDPKPIYEIGFTCAKDYYNIIMGQTTYITGVPSHGKSTFLFEMLINLSQKYGIKHTIMSPETGDPVRQYIEILQMVTKKSFREDKYMTRMKKSDIDRNHEWLSKHFQFIEDGDHTINDVVDFIKGCNQAKTPMTFSIDPWNELCHDVVEREDLYISQHLGKIRRATRKSQMHTFILVHPKKMQQLTVEYEGNTLRFVEPPGAYDISGGGQWFNKAENILTVYIVPMHKREFNYQTRIIVGKVKFRECGQKGEFDLQFDRSALRYKEIIAGTSSYAWGIMGADTEQDSLTIKKVSNNFNLGEDPF